MITRWDYLLKTGEVAAIFGVDPQTVTRWVQAGRLPAVKTPSGQNRFRESEIEGLRAAGEPAVPAGGGV